MKDLFLRAVKVLNCKNEDKIDRKCRLAEV